MFKLMEFTEYFSRLSLQYIIKNNGSWIQRDCKLFLFNVRAISINLKVLKKLITLSKYYDY